MLIALDFDDTYTADPGLWDRFIELAKRSGHEFVCVTARAANDIDAVRSALGDMPIVATDGADKAPFCSNTGYWPDVWIDDRPHLIGRFF